MKITAIKHKSANGTNWDEYAKKLANAISCYPDLVIGPDYAMHFEKNGKVDFSLRDKILQDLSYLSLISPKTLVIPGTSPVLLFPGVMGNSTFAFRNGELVGEFRKETDYTEWKLAQENGLEYERGDSSKNSIIHNGKKITVEICSDYGKQRIDKDTYLEAILAYDDNAGFYVRATTPQFPRYMVLTDGRKPMTGCVKYEPKNPKIFVPIKGKEDKDFTLFHIEDKI